MMRGGVTFDALGKAWELRFTTNAICRIEERTGKPLDDVLRDTGEPGRRTVAFRVLIWAGIGGMTLEEAGDIMDDIGPVEVDRIVAAALRAAFPVKADDDAGDAGNGAATAV